MKTSPQILLKHLYSQHPTIQLFYSGPTQISGNNVQYFFKRRTQ